MTPSHPPYDRQALLRQFGGFSEIVDRVQQEFLKALPDTLAELEAAWQSGNSDAVRSAAHKIKGGFRTLHAAPAAECAAEIEDAAHAGRPLTPEQLGALKARMEEFQEFVAQEQKSDS